MCGVGGVGVGVGDGGTKENECVVEGWREGSDYMVQLHNLLGEAVHRLQAMGVDLVVDGGS